MKTPLKFILIPWVIKILMQLIVLTCRVHWHNRDDYEAVQRSGQPYVLGMWHNCSTIAAWVMKNTDTTVMVSNSKDGEYVSRLASLFKIDTIRGSSSSGAKKAIAQALKLLKSNKAIAITPDGPRGPRYKIQSGMLWLAGSVNAPVIPLHIESSRQWVLKSWDLHCFPKPFSTIHISFGTPTVVKRSDLETDFERVEAQVEKAMLDNVQVIARLIENQAASQQQL